MPPGFTAAPVSGPRKAALVTGGARRIGREIALTLARAGMDVAITFRESEELALATACEIEATGVRCLTLPMDVRLAADDARMGFVFARRGIIPEACSSWFLPRVVGISRAMEWVATGRVFSAQEGLEGGLLRSLHPQGELLDAAHALAREIAENTAPVSVALARQLMWRMLGAEHPMIAHRADSRGMFARGQSDDAVEGITAFLEKRPANFPDQVSDGLPEIMPWWTEPEFE